MILSCSGLAQETSAQFSPRQSPSSDPTDLESSRYLITDPLAEEILQQINLSRELADTSLATDIDRMIFNGLVREMLGNGEETSRLLGLSEREADELLIVLSNSLNYTNIDEARAHREMCLNWEENRTEAERVSKALAAYDYSIYRDKVYIAENDRMLLLHIERLLSNQAWEHFTAYMEDRRQRLLNFPALTNHSTSLSKGFDATYLQGSCNH